MKELYKIIDVKPIKPELWNTKSRLIEEVSHTIKTLVPFTAEEKYLVFKRKIIAPLPRLTKSYYKKPINNEIECDRWLVKSLNEKILGPYTKAEMKDLIERDELKDTSIKRDYDREFVKYAVLKEIPDFLESPRLNDFFNGEDTPNLINLESLQPFAKEKMENNKFKIDDRAGFFKCTEFLKYKKVSVKIEELIKKLYGKNKEAAVNIIGVLTNLKMEDCERLVDLIVLESKNSVIVDSDGFMKAHKKHTKKKSFN